MAVLFIIGTGDGSKIVKAENAVVGDLNSDNDVGTDDMNILCKYLVGDASSTGTDVNGDTAVDVRDLIRYKRYLTEASKTLTGEGTEAVPYLISSLADMYKFLEESQNSESAGKYYKVTADIVVNVGDATSLNPTEALVRQWNKIGTSGTPFAGTLDGNGKTINGIYLSDAIDLTNLLGWVGEGTVTGLNVDSSYISPTFDTTTSVKYTGDVTNSEIPACEASITTGTDTVFYQAFTDAMDVANTVNEAQPESATVEVVVLNDVTLSDQVQVKRNITIKNAPGKVVTIKSGIPSNTSNMFAVNGDNVTGHKATFTLEAQRKSDVGQLILDGSKVSTKFPLVSNGSATNTNTTFIMGEYVTIQNAYNPSGGGLYNYGTAVLNGDMKNNESSRHGAAIRNDSNGSLTISGGTYSGNSCTHANGGGVLYNNGGAVTIAGGTFSGNAATVGAVICNAGAGTITITGGTFSENKATSTGGGVIYNNSTGAVKISNASFSGNQAVCGGAIYNLGTGTTTIENTSFEGNGTEKINSTTITGGAIYNASTSGAVTISDSEFTNNGGKGIGEKGGAIYCASAAGTSITGGTFAGNWAECGGALCVSAGNVALSGVTMNGNYANSHGKGGGGALYMTGAAAVSIKEGASITNNINGKVANNTAKCVDISFANNGTCTLYLLDDTFKSGYLGCYLTDGTGNSDNKIVLSDNTEITMPYNQYYKVNFETKELYY